MGTHPSLPSKSVESGKTLLELVQSDPSLLSPTIAKKYGSKLPFLFKVLSINKALSIQAHPNKQLAEQLHARDPKNYPDDNHKPEMTIAVTPFDGLCGFRPLHEIAYFLSHVKPLRDLVGDATATAFETTVASHEDTTDDAQTRRNKDALRAAFSALMSHSTSTSTLSSATAALLALTHTPSTFCPANPTPTDGPVLARLLQRLDAQFPADIGLFVLFFLNYVQLDVGEAMFLRADDVHAYLSGDIIECMASSDNVVRAGFTPKFRDVDTLANMLTYSYAPIAQQKMPPQEYPYVTLNAAAYASASEARLYDPPIEEFAVVRAELKRSGAKATFEGVAGPSVMICTGGEGTVGVPGATQEIREGWVYFVGAGAEVTLQAGEGDALTVFKAFCEIPEAANGHASGKM